MNTIAVILQQHHQIYFHTWKCYDDPSVSDSLLPFRLLTINSNCTMVRACTRRCWTKHLLYLRSVVVNTARAITWNNVDHKLYVTIWCHVAPKALTNVSPCDAMMHRRSRSMLTSSSKCDDQLILVLVTKNSHTFFEVTEAILNTFLLIRWRHSNRPTRSQEISRHFEC